MNREKTVVTHLRIGLTTLALFAAGYGASPSAAQTATPAKAGLAAPTNVKPDADPNGVMLGSWNTQAEFDDVKIASGTNVVLHDSFDTARADWQRDGGDWQVSGGVCRQTSSATPALEKFVFNNQGTNYTVSVRARKLSGAEGFLVGFGARRFAGLLLAESRRLEQHRSSSGKIRGRRAKSDWPGGQWEH